MWGSPCPLCENFITGVEAESKAPSQETHVASDCSAFPTSLGWSCGIWIHQGSRLLFGVTWWWLDSLEGKPSLGWWCCLGRCSATWLGLPTEPQFFLGSIRLDGNDLLGDLGIPAGKNTKDTTSHFPVPKIRWPAFLSRGPPPHPHPYLTNTDNNFNPHLSP